MGAAAQQLANSVSTYSPYSMYGMGELSTKGNVIQRSMGGVGVAMWTNNMVNVMNPAAYALTPQQSFLFNFGVEGGHFRNAQDKYGASTTSTVRTAYNTINIHDIAFQMPLAKDFGLGFSLTPYSNVGYNMYSDDLSQDVIGNVGRVNYQYNGDGDVTEVKAGLGWKPFRSLAIGAAAMYYWGNINRAYNTVVTNITGDGAYASTKGIDTYDVSRIKFQTGIMWNPIYQDKHILTFGATYDLGGAVNPDVVKYVYVDNILTSVVRLEEEDALPLRLPQQVSAGVFYQNLKIRVGADYVYQDWGSRNESFVESGGTGVRVAYTDTHTVKVGLEVVPRYSDVAHYFNRVAYRIGARMGDYYQTFGNGRVKQYALTAGLGFPIRLFGRSSINLGFEAGMRRPDSKTIMISDKVAGTIRQTYYKFSLGLNLFGEDRWFVRQKFN